MKGNNFKQILAFYYKKLFGPKYAFICRDQWMGDLFPIKIIVNKQTTTHLRKVSPIFFKNVSVNSGPNFELFIRNVLPTACKRSSRSGRGPPSRTGCSERRRNGYSLLASGTEISFRIDETDPEKRPD